MTPYVGVPVPQDAQTGGLLFGIAFSGVLIPVHDRCFTMRVWSTAILAIILNCTGFRCKHSQAPDWGSPSELCPHVIFVPRYSDLPCWSQFQPYAGRGLKKLYRSKMSRRRRNHGRKEPLVKRTSVEGLKDKTLRVTAVRICMVLHSAGKFLVW